MKFKGILIGAVLLAVLSGGVYWSIKHSEEQDKKSAQGAPKELAIGEGEIQQLEIKRRGDETVVVKRIAGMNWDIVSPVQLHADVDTVNGILQVLGGLTPESLIEDKISNWEPFGLKDPTIEVTATLKDGKKHLIAVGDDLPAGGSMYVRANNDTKLYSVAGYQRSSLAKGWRDLRDRRLMPFESEKLSRLEMVKGGTTIEFGRIQNNEWQIVKPKPYRADSLKVDEMSRRLRDARLDPAQSEADEKSTLAKFNAASPFVTIRATDPSGNTQLEVRKARDTDKTEDVYYAKSASVSGAHKLNSELGQILEKKLDDFRNRKLFDFGFNDPSKIEYTQNGKTRSFGRNTDKWLEGGKEVKAENVQIFIDRLRELTAKDFVDAPKPLTKADIEVSVTSTDGKRTETIRIAGNLCARGSEPAAYTVDTSALEELTKQASRIEPVAAQQPANKPAADGKK